jgi:hypothetical protein
MGDEPYLEQLIDALRQLRARVIQVRAGQPAGNERAAIDLELGAKLIEAQAISSVLMTSRLPDTLDEVDEGTRNMEKSVALKKALEAIRPDFSVDAIDDAISVAVSQRRDFQ